MQAPSSVIYFPKQSKRTGNKHPKEKCTVLDWIRSGAPVPFPPPPPKPTPGPITVPPSPDNPPRKPGEKGGA